MWYALVANYFGFSWNRFKLLKCAYYYVYPWHPSHSGYIEAYGNQIGYLFAVTAKRGAGSQCLHNSIPQCISAQVSQTKAWERTSKRITCIHLCTIIIKYVVYTTCNQCNHFQWCPLYIPMKSYYLAYFKSTEGSHHPQEIFHLWMRSHRNSLCSVKHSRKLINLK